MSDNSTERYLALKEQLEAGRNNKIRLEERLLAEKKKLIEVLQKIQDKGIDPKEIDKVVQDKRDALDARIDTFEKEVTEMTRKLEAIEAMQ